MTQSPHLQPFQPRPVRALPILQDQGWTLKRYAILADGRDYDANVAAAAGAEALKQLPKAGNLQDASGNHGVGFQLVHFAQTAVVTPVFYWRWGSVLAHIGQMRASWDAPLVFQDGVADIIGCIWEMDIVSFETHAWKTTVLQQADGLAHYLEQQWEKTVTT